MKSDLLTVKKNKQIMTNYLNVQTYDKMQKN